MKRLLIPLLAALSLPIAVNAEVNNDYRLKFEQAKKLIREGKASELEPICDELLEIAPEIDLGYVCKGIALVSNSKNKKKREAIRNFTKAIKINPENYDAYSFRGALKLGMRRRRDLGFNRTACKDMEKAYLNNHPFALAYVKKNKSSLGIACGGFLFN